MRRKIGVPLSLIVFVLLLFGAVAAQGRHLPVAVAAEAPQTISISYYFVQESGEEEFIARTQGYYGECIDVDSEDDFSGRISIPEGYLVEWRTADGSLSTMLYLVADVALYGRLVKKSLILTVYYGKESYFENVMYGDEVTMPQEIDGYAVDGAFFDAPWANAAVFPFRMEENTTLYLKFLQRTVSLVLDGKELFYDFGKSLVVEEREGYAFDGFYLDSDYQTPFDGVVTEAGEIYSKYVRKAYRVSLVFETGEEVRYVPVETPFFTEDSDRDGFLFWCVDESKQKMFDSAVPLTEDILLFACYTWDMYTLEYIDADGTVLMRVQSVIGSTPLPPEVPIWEGYRFIGWGEMVYRSDSVYEIRVKREEIVENHVDYNINVQNSDGTLEVLFTARVGDVVAVRAPQRAGKVFSVLIATVGTEVISVNNTDGGGSFLMPDKDVTVVFIYVDAEERSEMPDVTGSAPVLPAEYPTGEIIAVIIVAVAIGLGLVAGAIVLLKKWRQKKRASEGEAVF